MNHSQSWHMRSSFSCGDRVFDVRDPRHVGRVDGVEWNTTASITWDETGWKSHVPVKYLRLDPESVPQTQEAERAAPRAKPTTFALSPKRKAGLS